MSNSSTDPSSHSSQLLGFWTQPSFPKYRKVEGGVEKPLDGSETGREKIVKYDHDETYKEFIAHCVSKSKKR